MAKISANYEVVFIIDPAQGEEGVAALTEKFKTLVEQNSSAMEVEEWGKRKLAYAINYITEGYYVLISFTSAPEFPKELDRILRITDGVIRSMIVCKYFTKGRMAVVEGRLQIRDWKDKDGNNRRSAEVVADNVYFGDSKRDGASGGDYAPPAYGSPASTYSAPAGGGFAEIEEDGELPF